MYSSAYIFDFYFYSCWSPVDAVGGVTKQLMEGPSNLRIFRISKFSKAFRGLGGSWRLWGRPAIHIQSQDIDPSSKKSVSEKSNIL